MNDELLNLLFDEIKLCKSQINVLQTNIDNLQKEQKILKESMCSCKKHSIKTVFNTETLRTLAFNSFHEKQFDPLIDTYITKYKSVIKTFKFLSISERTIIPVIIIPTVPEIPEKDEWKENKRKEFYTKLHNDFLTIYQKNVSFGNKYTYVTPDKTYKTAFEFLKDVGSPVNISKNKIRIQYQLIVDGTSVGFSFEVPQKGINYRGLPPQEGINDSRFNHVCSNAQQYHSSITKHKHSEWINESPLKSMYVLRIPCSASPHPYCFTDL